MADDKGTPADTAEGQAKPKKRLMMLLLSVVGVIALAAVAGTVMGSLGGGPQTASADTVDAHGATPAPVQETGAYDYYEFDPIIQNLDEPRLARYVRVTVILELPADDKTALKEIREHLDARRAKLNNWMMIYLAGCSLDEVRGENNLKRLQVEIKEAFNDQLWPDQAPKIHDVLFKDFAVQ